MFQLRSKISKFVSNAFGVIKSSVLVSAVVLVASFSVSADDASSELNLPDSAAVTPAEAQAAVISVFSNEYSAPVNPDYLKHWSTGSLTEATISGDDVLSYTDMGYVGIQVPAINASEHKSFHVDLWSPVDAFFKVKIVNDPSGTTSEGVWVDSLTAGQWKEIIISDISNSDIGSLDLISQIVLDVVDSDDADTAATVSGASLVVDNIYFFDATYVIPDPVSLTVYKPGAEEVRLSGPSWEWSLDGGPLATGNGDGYWTVVLDSGPTEDLEYLWVADGEQENIKDNFDLGECDDNGLKVVAAYANRVLAPDSGDVTGDIFGACKSSVTFSVEAVGASSVIFYSDLNEWMVAGSLNALLSDTEDNIWSVTIDPAPASEVNYLWVVDGNTENLIDQASLGLCANDGLNTDGSSSATRLWAAGSGDVSGEIYNTCTSPVYNFSATFSEEARTYNWMDIGPDVDPSANTSVIDDPADAGNKVAYSMRDGVGYHPSGGGATTKPWNGTLFVATEESKTVGFSFAADDSVASMRVRSSTIGKPVSLKLEDADGNHGVATKAFTTVADEWETLYFDFATPYWGDLVLGALYSKVIIMYDENSEESVDQYFYFDDITYGEVTAPVDNGPIIALPVDFELEAPDYAIGSNGNSFSGISDEIDGLNALKYIKYGETFGSANITLDTPVDFKDGYKFTARVYSSVARPITMKFDDASTEFHPVQVTADMAGAGWETITFDFSGIGIMPQSKISFIQDIESQGGEAEDWTVYIDDITQHPTQAYVPADDAQTFSLVVNDASSVRLVAEWNWDMNSSESPIAFYSGGNTWTVVMENTQTDSFEYRWVVDGVLENLLDDVVAEDCVAKLESGTLVTDENNAVYANRKWLAGSGNVRDAHDNCISPVVLTVKVEGSADEVRMSGAWWDAENPWDINLGPVATKNADDSWSVTLTPELDMEYLWVVDGVQESLVENAADGECATDEDAGTIITNHSTYANRVLIFDTGDMTVVYGACSGTINGFDDSDEDGTLNLNDPDDDNDGVNDEDDAMPYNPNFSEADEVAFTLVFDGAEKDDDNHVYTFPTGSNVKAWAGFANGNEALYPFTLSEDSLVVFTASVPEGGDAEVRFLLQNEPWPANTVEVDSSIVTVSGATEATYMATFDSQGNQAFNSLLMYLNTRDVGVMIKHVTVIAVSDLDSDGDGVADGVDAFPNDSSETLDTDSDGIGNNTDPDDDNDGVADTEDSAPLDPAIGGGSNPPVASGSWDFDQDGNADALTDGLMLLRYTFGLRGDALVAGAIAAGSSLSASQVEANVADSTTGFADIDGSDSVDALTDGLMLLRYLFGLRGDPLISGATAIGAERSSAAQVEAYIISLMPN